MTFPMWAGVFVDFSGVGSKIPAAFVNQIRLQIPNAVDGAGGGTYAPTAQIILGGTGLSVTGPGELHDLTVLNTNAGGADFDLNGATQANWNGSGTAANFLDGAVCNIDEDSELQIRDGGFLKAKSGSTSSWESGSTSTWHSGSTVAWNSGSSATFSGTLLLSGTTMQVTTGKTLRVNNGGTLQFGSGGLIDDDGSTGNFSGVAWTFDTSTALILSGSGTSLAFNSSSKLTMSSSSVIDDNGSSGTFNDIDWTFANDCDIEDNATYTGTRVDNSTISGTQTDSSTITRTGHTILSGSGAYTNVRSTTLSDTSQHIDGSDQEIYYMNNPAANRHHHLDAPPGGRERVMRMCVKGTWDGAHNVQITDTDSGDDIWIIGVDGASDSPWADFHYDGSKWRPVGWGISN